MKKILYLLSIFFLPLVTFSDLLPEPSNNKEGKINDESGIVDTMTDVKSDENTEIKNKLIESNVIAEGKVEDGELHEVGADGGLTRVSFGYCNEGIDNLSETLNYAVNQGSSFNVCLFMSNATNQDVKVKLRLVDLVFVDGNELCSVNDTTIYNFIPEDVVKSFDEITIPAGNYIIKEFEITYPIGIEGDQGACTMFNVIKDGENQGNVASIVNRAYPMKFFVGTINDVKNIISVDNIKLSLDDNKDLIMNFDIKNEGNLENLVELSGTISNIFGYNKKFSIEGGHVLPGNYWHVEANLGSIPSYGGLFNIKFKAFATPYFSYDISKSNIDPSLIEMKTFDFSTTYFKMPWLIFAIVIVVILLIIAVFKKPKQKVVYIQQQPIQPQQTQSQYYNQQNISQQQIQQTQVNQQIQAQPKNPNTSQQ